MARRIAMTRAMPIIARPYTPAKPVFRCIESLLSPTRLMNLAFTIDHSMLLQACEELSNNEDDDGSLQLWERSRPITKYMA